MKIPMAPLVLCVAACLGFSLEFIQQADAQSLQPNQTLGYGANQVVLFTYTQTFDCVDQPKDDLNFNNVLAQSDPAEFQISICQAGIQPTIDPTGLPRGNDPTEPLFVLVPMFSTDHDQDPNDAISCDGVVPGTNCGPALGSTLIQLFGALPEAFKAKPLVYTQCPEPGVPAGTCTMHTSRLDLGLALVQLGLLPPPPANFFVPSPNHSHILLNQDLNLPAIWWEVVPVLVFNSADWPSKDGSSGITSFAKMIAAEKAGDAVQVPSNFFLFFKSQSTHMH